MKILGVFAATAVVVIAVADLPGQSKEYCRNFPQSEACAGHIKQRSSQKRTHKILPQQSKQFVEEER